MSDIKVVVFDFDGVLVDSVGVKNDAMRNLFSDFGDDFSKEIFEYQQKSGSNRHETAQYAKDKLNVSDIDFVEKYAENYTRNVRWQIARMPLNNGGDSTLMSLIKDLPVYISSGTPEKELIDILRDKCMKHMFKETYGSPDRKEDHFERILKEENVKPENVLFIGDMPSDYEVAKRVGVEFLGYSFYDLESNPEVKTIDSLMEIVSYIKKRNGRKW